jgi:putative addiction module component (TIGR02574 family)
VKAEAEAAADRGGITAFQDITALRPLQQVCFTVRPCQGGEYYAESNPARPSSIIAESPLSGEPWMSPTAEQLLTSALTLPESERLELAEALLAASEPPAPEPTGDAWLAELHRRSAEIDAGGAALAPWPEVKRRVRARLEGRGGG